MSNDLIRGLKALLPRLFGGLGARQLMWIALGLFLVDLILPDPIPFVDEALLGLLTLLFATLGKDGDDPQPPVGRKPPTKNVTPRD